MTITERGKEKATSSYGKHQSSTGKATVGGECSAEKRNSEFILESIRKIVCVMDMVDPDEGVLVSRLSLMREEEDVLNAKQEGLLEKCGTLSSHIRDAVKSLRSLQDEREDLIKHVIHLQKQTKILQRKIQDDEAQLRKETDNFSKWFASGARKTKGRHEKQISSLRELEKAKRVEVVAQFKHLEQTLDSERAERVKLKEDLNQCKSDLDMEKMNVLCLICLEAVRDTIILPCTHFLYCNGCLLKHKKKRKNTCLSGLVDARCRRSSIANLISSRLKYLSVCSGYY